MLHEINEFDFIFLSYDEPNAEELFADLLDKVPWAKRVSGVKGLDAAHRACADASDTDFFITVDGDNRVHDEFLGIKVEIAPNQTDHAWSWTGRNIVNGLVYGNGGLKLWSKEFVRNMQSHENSNDKTKAVDFCWDHKYHDLFGCYSTNIINGSPYQAFRSGFREGVKMSLMQGNKVKPSEFLEKIWIHNVHKLSIWCSIGADVPNGIWAIYGARLGTYQCNLTDWDYTQISYYDWFQNFWKTVENHDPVAEGSKLLPDLRRYLGIDIAEMDAFQSKFFKSVYINPNRRFIQSPDEIKHMLAV